MALDADRIKQNALTALAKKGFDLENAPMLQILVEEVTKAVVDDIKTNADVAVTSGSSAGVYKVN